MSRLLLLSSSRVAGRPEEWLTYASSSITHFLGQGVRRVLFLPYAAVTFPWDEYEEKARSAFAQMGYGLTSLHRSGIPRKTLAEAEVIVVGGGNTFQLLDETWQRGLLDVIRERVLAGVPYIGWSAGSNLACPTIKTTNDMPICWPKDLGALDLVRFQINPHFTDAVPPGHQGETRSDRLQEFVEKNPDVNVVGLPEGDILHVENSGITLIGQYPITVFRHRQDPRVVGNDVSLRFLL